MPIEVPTRKVPLDEIDYRWQDSERDLAISRMHERMLNNDNPDQAEGYRLGVSTSSQKGANFIALFYDIQRNGVQEPLRLGPGPTPRRNLRIILGNRRLSIARALGIKELACEIYGPPGGCGGGRDDG